MKATLQATRDKRFRCGECLSQFQGRPDEEDMLGRIRSVKACFGVVDRSVFSIDDCEFHTCPGNFFDRGGLFLIELWRAYKNHGTLPFEGCYIDQPAKVMEAFSVIEEFDTQQLLENQKKERLKNRGNRKSISRSRR